MAQQLQDPLTERIALDNLQLSLATGKHLNRVMPTPETVADPFDGQARVRDRTMRQQREEREHSDEQGNMNSYRKRDAKRRHKDGQ